MRNYDKFELMAQYCLDYLISDPAQLAEFMKYSGLDAQGIRENFTKPDFKSGLLDYFASNEPALLAMCAMANCDVKEFMQFWHQYQNMDRR